MSTKTAVLTARVEPSVKKRAEDILGRLGLSTSTAIDMYYRQVIRHRGLPFEVKVDDDFPVPCIDDLTPEELEAELQKGMDDVKAGRVISAEDFFKEMEEKYGLHSAND